MKKIIKLLISSFQVFVLLVTSLFIIFYSFNKTATSYRIYEKILRNEKLLNKIINNISVRSGLNKLHKIDNKIYYKVLNVIRTDIKQRITKIVINDWIAFVQRDKEYFDPIISLKTLKLKIYGILKIYIYKDKRIPTVFKKSANNILTKKINMIPSSIKILKFVHYPAEVRNNINLIRDKIAFSLKLIKPIFFILLLLVGCFLIPKKSRIKFFSISGLLNGVLSGTVLLFVLFFKEHLIDFALNMLTYSSMNYSEVKTGIIIFLNEYISNVKCVSLSFFILSIIPILIMLFKKKEPDKIF